MFLGSSNQKRERTDEESLHVLVSSSIQYKPATIFSDYFPVTKKTWLGPKLRIRIGIGPILAKISGLDFGGKYKTSPT